MITSEEIKARLWEGANELRGSMDASRYKDYMLGLMFYKFLSDQTLNFFAQAADLDATDDIYLNYAENYREYNSKVEEMLQAALGFFVKPEHLYQTWIKDMNEGNFEVQKVADSFSHFERNIQGKDDFTGLFANSTLNLTDTALGSTLNERSKNIQALIRLFEDLDMMSLQKGDILGDAYEYLIGQFAMESGKKAGEFYTPHEVSEVMAQIVSSQGKITSIYDPTVGSGSLLLTVRKHLKDKEQMQLEYYGQEKNTATYNLSRMNLLLHGVTPSKMTIKNGDTLGQDWPEDPKRPHQGVQFDAVVMNPPYSLKNWNRSNLTISDPRFEMAGALPPESKGDFAFLLHGLYHLSSTGTMAIVLPHGVLFRSGAEGIIRQRLLEKNQVDAVIGLPAGMFTNTGIPVCIMILKKNRQLDEDILFIDASNNFEKVGKQNVLQAKDIAKIVDTYKNKQEELGFSHLASRAEIQDNDYNLNIPRYVEVPSKDIPHDVDGHLYGGIPIGNLRVLSLLTNKFADVLNSYLEELRPGYVTLSESIETIQEALLTSDTAQQIFEQVSDITNRYLNTAFDHLHDMSKNGGLRGVRESMLESIKSELSIYAFLNQYDAYQVIAELWADTLNRDAEYVERLGFYSAGRTKEANMVLRGKKGWIQEGWRGVLIPNALIATEFYGDELQEIDDLKQDISEIDGQLSEWIDLAKSEEEEYNPLLDVLAKNDDGDYKDSVDSKLLKAALKELANDSPEYQLLSDVDIKIKEKAKTNKVIKEKEAELNILVSQRLENLTDGEVDHLLYKKWFGHVGQAVSQIVERPLKLELKQLADLNSRYADTMQTIDADIKALEDEIERLMADLVVTN